MSGPLHDRARYVCTHCHLRKVRCDLQECRDGVCNNCRRSGQKCIRRDGSRRTRQPAQSPDLSVESSAQGAAEHFALPDPPSTSVVANDVGYIAEHSVLSAHDPATMPSVVDSPQGYPSSARDAILRATEADVLPKSLLQQALTDAFFDHVYYQFPVVDRQDLQGPNPSVLLQQAVCMAGSLTRPTSTAGNPFLTQSLYEKVRTLLHLRYEPDTLIVLKAMCLMANWSPFPSNAVGLDGPWYWTGVATRLAYQLGLHKHSSYSNRPDSGCRKRIWWTLFNSDTLQGACFGRPAMIRPADVDVPLPGPDDFREIDTTSSVFTQSVNLCMILGKIVEHSARRCAASLAEASHLKSSLSGWLCSLPDNLRLFNSNGYRLPYKQSVSNLHILYFVSIILLQTLQSHGSKRPPTSFISVVASSCITRLYEEMYHREHVSFLLTINNFYCMVAAVPQIYYIPQSEEKAKLRREELATLSSIVEQMKTRFGIANNVMRNMANMMNEVENNNNTDTSQVAGRLIGNSTTTENTSEADSTGLFAFPASLCSNMDMLSTRTDVANFATYNLLSSSGEDFMGWGLDDSLAFADVFGLDMGTEFC